MASNRGRLEGRQAKEEFKRMGKVAESKIEKALQKAGLIVERDAKINCPVDTGRLRSSISSRVVDGNVAEIGSNVNYARYVNYGTTKMSPRPYLSTALITNKIKIKRLLMQAIRESMGG